MFACALVLILLGAPPSPEAIAKARADVLSDPDYQTRWSLEDRPAPNRWSEGHSQAGDGGDDWQPFSRRARTRRPVGFGEGVRFRKPRRPPSDRTPTLLPSGLVIGVAIVFAVVLLVLFLSAWWGTPRDIEPKTVPPPKEPAPTRAPLTRPQSEAEHLAKEGRYDEAVHVLLLETLRALTAHTRGGVSDALTSREVVREVDMPDAARKALGNLVTTVERSLFGQQSVHQRQYHECLEAFDRFRSAYQTA